MSIWLVWLYSILNTDQNLAVYSFVSKRNVRFSSKLNRKSIERLQHRIDMLSSIVYLSVILQLHLEQAEGFLEMFLDAANKKLQFFSLEKTKA